MISTDYSAGAISIDGELFSPAEARIPAMDRGFLYGDSAFEVMRTYGTRPFREREHLLRLERSCRGLLIPLPVPLDTLSGEIHRAIQITGLPECYLRVVVTRGGGPVVLDLLAAAKQLRVVFALPLRPIPPEHYEKGISVSLVADVGLAANSSVTRGTKSSNYLNSVLALHRAVERGSQEAVAVGRNGELLEGSSSNFFIVKNGVLLTPRLEVGILGGVTRATVIELAREAGIEVKETILYPTDLYAGDEAFITSTLRELVPVVSVDGATIGGGAPGPVYRDLLRSYRERAGGG